MRIVAVAGLVAILVSAVALAQSGPPAPGSPEDAPKISNITGTPQPVPAGKWMTCHTSAQALQGQDRKDQTELCLAQARLDCLKQAIAQKVVGPQRRDYIKTCMTE
jgi:hypothetical protein